MRWWAPRDSSAQLRAAHDGLRHVEHAGQLERGDELGVERAAVVLDPGHRISLLQLAQLVGGLGQRVRRPVDPGALLHGLLHLGPDR